MNDRMPISIVLADDDDDDCLLFYEALSEISIPTQFSAVHNGEQLLQQLQTNANALPHILFLDLNMPRMNGLQCLKEINKMSHVKQMRVVIFSTSYHQDIADQLYKNGAMHYIRKPSDFVQLKQLIEQVLILTREDKDVCDRKDSYVLSAIQNQ
jgi:DNA-binding NtrC family response regulator